MNRSFYLFIAGFIAGAVIIALVLFLLSPRVILKENLSKYDFDESVVKLKEVITEQGWKIPVTHDLQATMKKHGKADVNKVMVLELCNPDLAEKILQTDDERIVANMMPCRIALYEKSDGKTYYSRMNSGLLSKPMGKIARIQMKTAANDIEDFLGCSWNNLIPVLPIKNNGQVNGWTELLQIR